MHTPSGERERGEKVRHRSERTRGTHFLECAQTVILVRTWKESRRTRGTHSLEGAEGRQVRRRKGSERARSTHELESAEGQVRTTMKIESAKGDLHPGRGANKDAKTKRVYEGHSLSVERESEDKSWHKTRGREGHSRTGEPRARNKSGHGKAERSERARTLTSWRARGQI